MTDKVMDSIRGDEMRSLLLAGVVPRMSARQQEDGGEHTARRPSTVPTQMGMARQGSGLSWDSMGRPSTVHYGGFRPTPTTPQEISEMLAYRPVPRDLQVEDWADELLENEGSQGPRSPKAARGSVSLRELSTSRSMTPRASSPSRPGSRGVDLLAKQARKDHAMRSEALARHHSSGSLVESRHEPERLPSTGVRTTSRKESWGSSRALHKLHSMGSIPMAAAITQEVASPSNHGQPEAPGNAWVSPWTGRVSTPLIRSRGLALDARIVARTGLPPTPGVPVWKKSEEQGASQSAKVTRAVKTLPTDDDGGTTTAHRKTRSAGGSRGTYGRARGLTYADKYMSRLPATPHG